jgi:hypothetical protein
MESRASGARESAMRPRARESAARLGLGDGDRGICVMRLCVGLMLGWAVSENTDTLIIMLIRISLTYRNLI